MPLRFTPHFFPEIDSTNTAALCAVQAGTLAQPTLFHTASQTAGRGTRGREWQNQIGNVFATFAFPLRPSSGPALPNPHLLLYPLALAVARTVQHFTPAEKVTLKWPNDVLLNGQKVSGALHETAHDGQTNWFLAGIGLNVVWAPPAAATFHAATCLHTYNPAATTENVLAFLTENIEKALTAWPTTPWAETKAAYLTHAHNLGEKIFLSPHGNRKETITGLFEGVNDDGALVLRTPEGLRTFQTADIFPDLPAV